MLSLFVESTRVKIVLRFCVFFRPCAVFERFVVGAIGCLELPAVAHCCSCCRRWPGASATADWRPNQLYWQRNDRAVAAAAGAVAALVHALGLPSCSSPFCRSLLFVLQALAREFPFDVFRTRSAVLTPQLTSLLQSPRALAASHY